MVSINKIIFSLQYAVYSHNYAEKYLQKYEGLFSKSKIALPARYGVGLSERVIEIPWAMAKLQVKKGRHLDAGSTLNFGYAINHPKMKNKQLIIQNLNQEKNNFASQKVSYLYGDLREPVFDSGYFDSITCLSVIEHIGMDNTGYVGGDVYKENRQNDYLKVISEFGRILKKGGVCLITVPYGRHESHGWLQVFDAQMVKKLIRTFKPASYEVGFFKYTPSGWVSASPEECKNCGYPKEYPRADRCVGAESVACIFMKK